MTYHGLSSIVIFTFVVIQTFISRNNCSSMFIFNPYDCKMQVSYGKFRRTVGKRGNFFDKIKESKEMFQHLCQNHHTKLPKSEEIIFQLIFGQIPKHQMKKQQKEMRRSQTFRTKGGHRRR